MIPNELYYFVPGQVILHIEHDKMTRDNLEAAIATFLSIPNPSWNQLALIKGNAITFPLIKSDHGKYISILLTQFDPYPLKENELDLNEHQNFPINQLIQLYTELGTGIFISHDPYIFLRTLAPNLLASGTPHQPGLGGPGSWPEEAVQPSDHLGKFTLPGHPNLNEYNLSSIGEKVEVAILDTAPSSSYYMGSVGGTPMGLGLPLPDINQWPDHNLLQKLLGQGGKLVNNIVGYQPTWKDFCFSLQGHGYLMPDHGLFIAGIIYNIAPGAQLKLYEVLNPYGAGSYYSIYAGLERALADFKGRDQRLVDKLIINLSLVLNLPVVLNLPQLPDKGNIYVYMNYDLGITDKYIEQEQIECFDKMSFSIREILRQIVGLKNVLVVAAAGNDAKEGSRPCTRYPAACQGVIGVGALPKDSLVSLCTHRPATYSNICDQPLDEGYMTLGGESGVNNGIRGVFIHDFPNRANPALPIKNNSGWAWWAGTSFAAPIISGMLAAGWSKSWGSRATVGVSASVKAHSFLNLASAFNTTNIKEKVIVVTQA
jgi:hypothetical protein